MSWAKEEWKEGLSQHVLTKIHSLEDQNVQLKSDLKQRQFNCDSLQASVNKYVSFKVNLGCLIYQGENFMKKP